MRIKVVAPYVVFYRYVEPIDTVQISRIVHGKRNITGRLLRSPK